MVWLFAKSHFCRGNTQVYPVLHPDVFWYHLNGMGTQKNAPEKVLVKLFPYKFHVKPKWNIIYKYLKTKIFSRESNILPQMHWTLNIFGQSTTIIGIFWISWNCPILNFKKTICTKNVWMQHCHLQIFLQIKTLVQIERPRNFISWAA